LSIGGRYKKDNGISTDEALTRFGKMLKDKRLSLNITQAKLKEHSGVSLTVIKRLESGKPISTNNLMSILRSYELLPEILTLYVEPELSLEEQWVLQQKKEKNKRVRASAADTPRPS